MSDTPTVHQALVAASQAVGAIGKDRENTQQNFKFRGVDDVMNALHRPLADNGVVIAPEVIDQEWGTWQYGNDKKLGVACRLTIRYNVFGPGGDRLEPAPVFVGEARDTADKAASKAMSTAYKYLAFQLFCIPVAGQDEADRDSPVGSVVDTKANRRQLVLDTAASMFDAAGIGDKNERNRLWALAAQEARWVDDPDMFVAVLQEKVNEVSGAAVPNDEQPSSSPAAAPEPVTDDRKEDVTNVSGADSVTASTLEGMEASGGGGGTDAASKQAGEDPSPPSDDLRALAAKLQAPPLRTERQVKPLRDWCHDVMAGLVVAGLWDPGKVHETLTVYEIEDVSAERSPNKLHELVTYLRAKGGKAVAEAAERAGVDLEVRP